MENSKKEVGEIRARLEKEAAAVRDRSSMPSSIRNCRLYHQALTQAAPVYFGLGRVALLVLGWAASVGVAGPLALAVLTLPPS